MKLLTDRFRNDYIIRINKGIIRKINNKIRNY